MKRRSFARRLLATTGALGVPGLATPFLGGCDRDDPDGEKSTAPSPEPAEPTYTHFDTAQARTLGAFVDTLLPPDDPPGSPGGMDAGVLTFVDRQLGREEFQKFQRFFQDGAALLDREARRLEGAAFHALGPDPRRRVVEKLQFGELESGRFPAPTFFAVAHSFALEGFFGAPKHGGNRDRVAWRWAGIDMSCPDNPPRPG